ncbi:MAG: PilX N-terminal domain-containing pilus assembly protein [Gammaproteobacteria bacterium]
MQQQKGAALVIGLVLLTVLTLLTASSMTTSTLSLRMADNVKQQDIASQAAESALMRALTSNAPFLLAGGLQINDPVREDFTFTYNGNGSGAATSTVSTLLKDRLSPSTGCEMDDQQGGSGCTHQHFVMNAATASSRGGSKTQSMGFYIRVPN